MTISKANWNSEGDNLRFSLPFSKVDKERRTVSGFASLDNLDKQMDIVQQKHQWMHLQNSEGTSEKCISH